MAITPSDWIPTLALDLDGTITDALIFFNVLSNYWPGTVVVITFRKDRKKAEADLLAHNIRFDEVILVDSLEEKAKVIQERGFGIMFDDQDESLQGISPDRAVFKIRNGGNFDYDTQQWLYSDRTGRRI
jgi:uncharacterized HAD superfamily protein